MKWCVSHSVCVEGEADSLEHPVRDVLQCRQIGLKHQPDTHGVTSVRSGVHRSAEGVLSGRDGH